MADTNHTAALVERFLVDKRAAGCTQSTIYGYQASLKRFVVWIGDRPINRSALRGYLHHLQYEAKLRATTIERYWGDCGTFVAWIVKQGIAPAAPAPAALRLPSHVPDMGDDPRDRQVVPGSTEDLIEQFLDAKRAAGLSPKSITAYAERLGYFAKWLEGRPITRPTLRQYLISLQERNLAPATRASYFRDIVTLCRFLVTEGIWEKNPAEKLGLKSPKRLMTSYSREQIRQLLAVCDHRDRAIIVMLLDTGLRAGELCSFRRRDIDWQTGAFTVIGKGDKERAGWLNDFTLEVLRAYLDTRRDSSPWLWPNRYGQPITRNGVYQALRRAAIAAGIRGDVRRLVHSMRATFSKNYIKQGGSLDDLRQLLGHESLTMSSHYARLAQDDLAAQKRRINPLGAMFDEAA